MKTKILFLLWVVLLMDCSATLAEEFWQGLRATALDAYKLNQLGSAELFLDKALEAAQLSNARSDECLAMTSEIAHVYMDERAYGKAVLVLKKNLSNYDKDPCNKTFAYAEALSDLSLCLGFQNQFSEALSCSVKSATLFRQLCNKDDVRLSRSLWRLSGAQLDAKKFDEAHATTLETISRLKRIPKREVSYELITSHLQLAEIAAQKKDIEKTYRQAKYAIYLAEGMSSPRSGLTGIAFARSIKALKEAGALKLAAHLEWRSQQIEVSGKTFAAGVDPEGKGVGRWAKDLDDATPSSVK